MYKFFDFLYISKIRSCISKMKTRLILNNFDARINKIELKPKGGKTQIVMSTKMFDITTDKKINVKIKFMEVCAINFQINSFNNCVGSESFGLYEVQDKTYKIQFIDGIFDNRKKVFLDEGDYNYNEKDYYDLLNNRDGINNFEKEIDEYKLFIQNVDAGTYSILAKNIEIKWIK